MADILPGNTGTLESWSLNFVLAGVVSPVPDTPAIGMTALGPNVALLDGPRGTVNAEERRAGLLEGLKVGEGIDLAASTGLDALTQLMEAFVSIHANPMTDALCREGIKRAAAALERAHEIMQKR